jgi:transposase InsO family protein
MISDLCVVISDHPHKYNPRRRHSALDYLSPMEYERRELVRV